MIDPTIQEMIAAAIAAGVGQKIPMGIRSKPLKKEEAEPTAKPNFPDGHARPNLSLYDGDFS